MDASKHCAAFLAMILTVAASHAAEPVRLTDYFPPPESKGGWRTLLPDQGPPDAAQKAKIRATAGAWEHNLRAEGPTMLLVIRRGYIVGEWYNEEWLKTWGRNKAPGFYSTTKAYISTAFGLLLEDSEQGKLPGGKKLTLDTKVATRIGYRRRFPSPTRARPTSRCAISSSPPRGFRARVYRFPMRRGMSADRLKWLSVMSRALPGPR